VEHLFDRVASSKLLSTKHSPRSIKLQPDRQGKNIIKQQVNLFGQVIEWNIVEGLKTGFVIETEDSQEVDTEASLQKESKLKPNVICYDSSPSQHSIHQAVDVVRFAGPLHQFDKDVVISNFLEAPKIASMDPKVFFETFGTKSNFGTKLTFFIKILRRFFK
ncbi:MAG: hypothetical protein SGJ18_03065, partial [Pseudomonadota bacterium]|nr:hypothetical protein [Pseudomonadota bacterium]